MVELPKKENEISCLPSRKLRQKQRNRVGQSFSIEKDSDHGMKIGSAVFSVPLCLCGERLIDEFQRELNLPRGPRGLADDSEPAAVHDVEDVEELRAKFQRSHLSVSAVPDRRVLDDSDIEIVICRPTKRVAAQRS